MTNKFTTPCFVRVEDAEERGKLAEWLKGLGYILFKCDGPAIYCIDDYFQAVATSHPSYPNKLGIGCGYNIELFKALAAMNSENDREQWFCDDNGTWEKFGGDLPSRYMQQNGHKATVEELINHFEDQTMSKTIEKAAREFADREYEVGEVDWDALYKGYCWGAKGTLSQPLADRLTTVEKERVRAYYNGETFGKVSLIELLSYRRVLDGIFGEDFFKDMSK